MSDENLKYEREMHAYLEEIRQLCAKGFTDFIIYILLSNPNKSVIK